MLGGLLLSHVICAVCLDGSPPAYHLHRGHGSGINSWLVHVEVSSMIASILSSSSITTLQ